jgi:cell division initiation protein
MALTSEEVVSWPLKTGMRGYVVAQVDELLDAVADELDVLRRRVTELEAEREAVRESLDSHREGEEELRRMLALAQEAADQLLQGARQDAERSTQEASRASSTLVESARQTANDLIANATIEAERERASVRARLAMQEAGMRAAAAQLRSQLLELHALETETRGMLRGLHQDRLLVLDQPAMDVPDLADFDQETSAADAAAFVEHQNPTSAELGADNDPDDDLVNSPVAEQQEVVDLAPTTDAGDATPQDLSPAIDSAPDFGASHLDDPTGDAVSSEGSDDASGESLGDDPAGEHQSGPQSRSADLFADAPTRRRRSR